ncbi:bifunctional RNase H/acid phosphatase [Luteipulveratus mongoliensis]|uniref:Ribonuclease HI n=1 Tax=Luteipulveratus mongoliensis TaxID=571913 RepID=A0A0K1JIU0_9MICO|nr:bifunctional RNase H/acid phosphatase [Luteipulveratus mongoliensis]AKU16621.1 ribonuclease HI [Luteipulveratus mongoliensis]
MSAGAGRRLVVEADGGSRGNPGVAGYGALVLDAESSELLAERAAPLGKASNNVAEYSGLIAGLKAAEEIDPAARIDVRMDSKLVIEQMAGRWKIKHVDMQRLALEAREVVRRLLESGGSVTWTWIPREINKAADKLSNDGMDGETIESDYWRDSAHDVARSEETSEADETVEVAEQQILSTDSTPGAPPDVGRPTRILLVRHGVTDFTVQGRLDGRGGADPSLNDEGRAQAARVAGAVAARLKDASGEAVVVTSSLARAKETGAAVGRSLGVDPVEDADWDEQSFGEWDGLTFGEISERFPDDLNRLRSDEGFAVDGGGETHVQMAKRVEQAMQRTLALAGSGGTAVVATHRKPIMVILASILDISAERAWRLAASPASITGIEVWRDGNVSIAFLNDTHHHDPVG